MSNFSKLYYRRNTNAGFTFIEVIAAVTITGLVVASVFAIVQSSTADHILAASRLQAAYLAQEGIEDVRNRRDSYWVDGENWPNILGSLDGFYLAEDFFGKFNRVVEASRETDLTLPVPEEIIVVSVTVSWEDGRGSHDIVAKTKLYDWYKQ